MKSTEYIKTLNEADVANIGHAISTLEANNVFSYFEERMISNPSGQEPHQAMIEYGKSLGRHEVIGQLRNFVAVVVMALKQQKQIPITYGSAPIKRKDTAV